MHPSHSEAIITCPSSKIDVIITTFKVPRAGFEPAPIGLKDRNATIKHQRGMVGFIVDPLPLEAHNLEKYGYSGLH